MGRILHVSCAFIYFIILDACTEVNSLKPASGEKNSYKVKNYLPYFLLINILFGEEFVKEKFYYKNM